MKILKGIFAASISILNEDLSLNISKTIDHCESLIDNGCHGVAVFGSTGQAQLIPVSEKIKLLNTLSKSKYSKKYIIGTGFNSLIETVNFLKIATSLKFENFLIMPPAFYKYDHNGVVDFYSKLIEAVPNCKIILYNFEKLSGYKFDIYTVKILVKKFPKQIIGIKDSTYNIFQELKLKNFLVFPGSELKLLKGLQLGCAGIISATCNITSELSRKVYDDFFAKGKSDNNQKLCDVRVTFDKYNLISALHSCYSVQDKIYKNVLPPLSLLEQNDFLDLEKKLNSLNFKSNSLMAA